VHPQRSALQKGCRGRKISAKARLRVIHLAAALTDPTRQTDARALLRQRFSAPAKLSLKELLATAPLEGIDLERARGLGRDVDL
jgi:hypothetical protein